MEQLVYCSRLARGLLSGLGRSPNYSVESRNTPVVSLCHEVRIVFARYNYRPKRVDPARERFSIEPTLSISPFCRRDETLLCRAADNPRIMSHLRFCDRVARNALSDTSSFEVAGLGGNHELGHADRLS